VPGATEYTIYRPEDAGDAFGGQQLTTTKENPMVAPPEERRSPDGGRARLQGDKKRNRSNSPSPKECVNTLAGKVA